MLRSGNVVQMLVLKQQYFISRAMAQLGHEPDQQTLQTLSMRPAALGGNYTRSRDHSMAINEGEQRL